MPSLQLEASGNATVLGTPVTFAGSVSLGAAGVSGASLAAGTGPLTFGAVAGVGGVTLGGPGCSAAQQVAGLSWPTSGPCLSFGFGSGQQPGVRLAGTVSTEVLDRWLQRCRQQLRSHRDRFGHLGLDRGSGRGLVLLWHGQCAERGWRHHRQRSGCPGSGPTGRLQLHGRGIELLANPAQYSIPIAGF